MLSIFRRIAAVIQGKRDPAFAEDHAGIEKRLSKLQKDRTLADYERAEQRRLRDG